MHSPWVVGANTAMLNVTAIVGLQSIQELFIWARHSHSLPPSLLGNQPEETFRSPLPPGGLCLPQSGRLVPPVLLPLPGGPNRFRGLRRSGQSQLWPGPVCRGSLAALSGSWAADLPVPPRPGIVPGPRLQSLPGSHHPGARPARDHWSRGPAHPCGRKEMMHQPGAGC